MKNPVFPVFAVLAICLSACSEPEGGWGTQLRENDFILSGRITKAEAKQIEQRLGSTEPEWERVPIYGAETGPGLVLIDEEWLDYERGVRNGIRMTVAYRCVKPEDSIYSVEYDWSPADPKGDTAGLQARFHELYKELSKVFFEKYHQPLDSCISPMNNGGFEVPESLEIPVDISGSEAKACGHYYFGQTMPSLSLELHFYGRFIMGVQESKTTDH